MGLPPVRHIYCRSSRLWGRPAQLVRKKGNCGHLCASDATKLDHNSRLQTSFGLKRQTFQTRFYAFRLVLPELGAQYLVAWGCDRVVGVTIARRAAHPVGQVPVVGGAVVACQTHYVWQTLALPGGSLAHAVFPPRALAALRPQKVACALWSQMRL